LGTNGKLNGLWMGWRLLGFPKVEGPFWIGLGYIDLKNLARKDKRKKKIVSRKKYFILEC